VLVPSLLSAWTAQLEYSGAVAPRNLRFVAAGGAHVPERLARAARRVGIPVHEGYGLTECCSVVALNRPGACKAGTVGRPLHGIKVTIEDDEIVVRGPTVMDGYLNHEAIRPAGVWRTGDLGAFDAEGRLIVLGRRDSMLVTAAGRNIVPEWIESMVTADPRLAHCVLVDPGSGGLTAVLVPFDRFAGAFRAMSEDARAQHLAELVAAAPDYAKPARSIVVAQSDFRRQGLLTANGRPRRRAVEAVFARAESNGPRAPDPELNPTPDTHPVAIPCNRTISP